MVDRGHRALTEASGTAVFDLQGNGWRFTKGNHLRIELAQDDDPFLKPSMLPSSLTLAGVTLELPVRRVGPDALVRAPRLASDAGTRPRFSFAVLSRSGELTGVSKVEATVRRSGGAARPVAAGALRGRLGRTYTVSGRVFDRAGLAGDPASAMTVVPFDDRRAKGLRRRGFKRVKARGAWLRKLSRGRRGARLRLRFRGDRVYLVGRTSRRGGRALVVLNGRRKRVSFRSRRTRNRAVVFSARARPRRTNRLRLRVLRGRVEIDALGVRRP
jgi:hypothetical protein